MEEQVFPNGKKLVVETIGNGDWYLFKVIGIDGKLEETTRIRTDPPKINSLIREWISKNQ